MWVYVIQNSSGHIISVSNDIEVKVIKAALTSDSDLRFSSWAIPERTEKEGE